MVDKKPKKRQAKPKTAAVKQPKPPEKPEVDEQKERKQAIALAIADELAYIPQDCEYFIDTYCWVQDPDNVEFGGKSPFKMWDEQKRALKEIEEHRLNIILKARQLGITWLALGYALHGMVSKAGYTVVALSKRDEDAKELANRMEFMLRQLPSWLIQERTKDNKNFRLTFEKTAHEVTIYRADGSEASRFITMTAAQDSGRSFTAALVVLDEWAFQQWAHEIWTSAYPTINRPTGGKVIGLSTAKRVTLFQQIWERFTDFGFHRIFLAWWADPRRTPEWYEAAKKALSANEKYKQEYPATPEEAFSAGEGTSFPEFSLDIHVCEPFEIPAHWRRWMSVDNGYADPFSWLWYTVSEDGIVYVYREFGRDEEEPRLLHKEQAEKVLELMSHANIDTQELEPEKVDFCVAGLDAWSTHHRDQSGKDLIDYYREGGLSHIGFTRATTDRKLRKATVHHYLQPLETAEPGVYTARLQIFNTCTHLIECLPNLINDEADREKVADIADHEYDSLSYGLIAHHTERTRQPKEEMNEIQKHKQKLAKAHTRRRR